MASQFEYGATQATQPVRDYADDDAGEAGSEPPPRVWGRLIRFGTLEAIDLVADTEFVFGRRRESQIVLSHPQVSNKHCTIKRATASHTAVIQDWSTNGTFLNGIKLDKQAATTLPPSAVITLVHKIPRADALELGTHISRTAWQHSEGDAAHLKPWPRWDRGGFLLAAYIYQDAPLNARPSVDTVAGTPVAASFGVACVGAHCAALCVRPALAAVRTLWASTTSRSACWASTLVAPARRDAGRCGAWR